MAFAFITKNLVQATNGVALGLVVDVDAHQIVVARQVGVERVDGHSGLMVRADINEEAHSKRAVGV